jgi:hypothetical protein
MVSKTTQGDEGGVGLLVRRGGGGGRCDDGLRHAGGRGLIEEAGRVVGIRAGDDEIRAGVVVAADGVNSGLARKSGLFGDAA